MHCFPRLSSLLQRLSFLCLFCPHISHLSCELSLPSNVIDFTSSILDDNTLPNYITLLPYSSLNQFCHRQESWRSSCLVVNYEVQCVTYRRWKKFLTLRILLFIVNEMSRTCFIHDTMRIMLFKILEELLGFQFTNKTFHLKTKLLTVNIEPLSTSVIRQNFDSPPLTSNKRFPNTLRQYVHLHN